MEYIASFTLAYCVGNVIFTVLALYCEDNSRAKECLRVPFIMGIGIGLIGLLCTSMIGAL